MAAVTIERKLSKVFRTTWEQDFELTSTPARNLRYQGWEIMELDFGHNDHGFTISEDGACLLKVTHGTGYLAVEPQHSYTPPTCELFGRHQLNDFINACSEILYSAGLGVDVSQTYLDYGNPLDREMIAAVHALEPQIRSSWNQFWDRPGSISHPQIAAVKRAIHSATGDEVDIDPHLIKNPALITAALAYRSAAIGLRYLDALWMWQNRLAYLEYLDGEEIHSESEAEDRFYFYSRAYLETPRVQVIQAICSLKDWRTLFSVTGQIYPELIQTLEKIPTGMDARLLCHLAQWRLRRPIYEGLELTAVLHFARRHPAMPGDPVLAWGVDGKPYLMPSNYSAAFTSSLAPMGKLIENATASDIRRAMAIVSDSLGLSLDPDRSDAVALFINFLERFDVSGSRTLLDSALSCTEITKKEHR